MRGRPGHHQRDPIPYHGPRVVREDLGQSPGETGGGMRRMWVTGSSGDWVAAKTPGAPWSRQVRRGPHSAWPAQDGRLFSGNPRAGRGWCPDPADRGQAEGGT